MQIFLNLPESDGAIPFVFLLPKEEKSLVLAGLSGGADGSEGLQGGVLDISEQKELIKEITEQGFVAVDPEKGFHILRTSFSLVEPVPDEWLFMQQNIKKSYLFETPNWSIGEPDIRVAERVAPIMDPETGLFMQIPEEILQDGMEGIVLAFRNDTRIQRQIIDAAVDACADVYWTDERRNQWQMAFLCVELVSTSNGQIHIAELMRHNRWLINGKGRDVPIVRAWVDRQLAQVVTIARLMARKRDADKSKGSLP